MKVTIFTFCNLASEARVMTTDYSRVPIIQGSYQLALDTQRLVAAYPKNYRYQIGDRLD